MDGAAFPTRVDEIGSWSEDIKHELLRRYLPEYTKILHNHRHLFPGGIHYIDAFAGTGQAKIRDEGRIVNGSPRIALDLSHPFDSYTFIEKSHRRAERLRDLVPEYPSRRIVVHEGDCNELIVGQIALAFRRDHRVRGFVFLDPFGMELEWATIEAVGQTSTLEVVLNLPIMAFNRGALRNGTDALTEEVIARMSRCWGSDEWIDLLYIRRDGLWGSHLIKAGPTGADRLGRLFKEHRLQKVFRFVSDPCIVRNYQGAPIYCLLFAGPNETGARIASHILERCLSMSPAPPPPTQAPLAMLF